MTSERVYKVERRKFKNSDDEVAKNKRYDEEEKEDFEDEDERQRKITVNLKKLNSLKDDEKLETSVSMSLKQQLFDRAIFRYPIKYVCHFFFCAKFRKIKSRVGKFNIYRSH